MWIKFYLSALLFSLALNAYGQQGNIETKKEQASRPEQQSKGRKSKHAVAKENKAEKSKPFIPSEKVSPDVPVSFPADI